ALAGSWPSILAGQDSASALSDIKALRPRDIVGATVAGTLLAIAWSKAVNSKAFIRTMQHLRITRKFGDEDVFDYTFNMTIPDVEFVNLRDFETRRIYSGYVKAYSQGGKLRELLLENAAVYDLDTGQALYEMPLLYLSR